MHFEFFSLETIQEWTQQYGYWVVFLGIMLENAGIPLPGETITLVGGFLSGNGELRYPIVLLCAVSGAILGDSIGYWLGRWGGVEALTKIGKFFRLPSNEIELAREKFLGSADRAVFFGRFVAILRVFAGPMAGLSGMSYPRFLFFNSTGALVWGAVTTGFAYYAGRLLPIETLVSGALKTSLVFFSVVVLWFFAPRVFRWFKQKFASPQEPAIVESLPESELAASVKDD